jgi:DNA-binding transcriptional LysR family regulator
MRLAAFNLNHLVALDALLVERHVGRAAAKLGVTQSAMSHTLRTLRDAMGDPLLVRVGNTMVLTPYAEQARERLQRGLVELESVVSGRAAFDPAEITDTFTLTTIDGVAALLAAPLHRVLRERAPKASLRIRALDPDSLSAQLERGDTDVALLPPMLDLSGLDHEPIASAPEFERSSVLCRADHPDVGDRITLARYCRLEHAVLTITGDGPSFIDHVLAQRNRARTVRVRTPYLFALADILACSDLINTAVAPLADMMCQRWPLKAVPLPLPIDPVPLLWCWHPRFAADPAHRFFREVLRAAARATLEARS